MASRFMTDPHAMRDMAGRFEVHAQTVEDEARRMWASAQNISGAGWSGMAEATSLDTMTQMNQAFRNIVNMLHGVRDGLVRDANNYDPRRPPRAAHRMMPRRASTRTQNRAHCIAAERHRNHQARRIAQAAVIATETHGPPPDPDDDPPPF